LRQAAGSSARIPGIRCTRRFPHPKKLGSSRLAGTPPIRPPTVAEGTARVRFSIGARMDATELLGLARLVVNLQGGAA